MRRSALGLALLSLVVACGDDAAPPTPPVTTGSAENESEAPPPDPDPPFDFRRAVLWPERHHDELRTCIVASLADAPEADPNDPDEAVARRQNVRCVVDGHVYEVRVLLPEAQRALSLAPPESPREARRLSLRILGLDAAGRRPLTRLEASSIIPQDLTPIRPPAPARPGFDFSRTATDASLLGTRQACAIRAASYVERLPPERRPSPDAVVSIPATCAHEGGAANAELLFTEDTLDAALLVAPGATAYGTLESPRHLRVSHVTPSVRR